MKTTVLQIGRRYDAENIVIAKLAVSRPEENQHLLAWAELVLRRLAPQHELIYGISIDASTEVRKIETRTESAEGSAA